MGIDAGQVALAHLVAKRGAEGSRILDCRHAVGMDRLIVGRPRREGNAQTPRISPNLLRERARGWWCPIGVAQIGTK